MKSNNIIAKFFAEAADLKEDKSIKSPEELAKEGGLNERLLNCVKVAQAISDPAVGRTTEGEYFSYSYGASHLEIWLGDYDGKPKRHQLPKKIKVSVLDMSLHPDVNKEVHLFTIIEAGKSQELVMGSGAAIEKDIMKKIVSWIAESLPEQDPMLLNVHNALNDRFSATARKQAVLSLNK